MRISRTLNLNHANHRFKEHHCSLYRSSDGSDVNQAHNEPQNIGNKQCMIHCSLYRSSDGSDVNQAHNEPQNIGNKQCMIDMIRYDKIDMIG